MLVFSANSVTIVVDEVVQDSRAKPSRLIEQSS